MYRVFLIDDEAWALISLERLIPWETLGFTICGKADNARIAWEKICQDPPDAVITDIRMPGMSGLELLERLRQNHMDISVILVSGFAEFRYAQEAVHHGAFEYLLKQINREQLTDCMKRLYQVLSDKKQAQADLPEKALWETLQPKGIREAASILLKNKAHKETSCFGIAACRADTSAQTARISTGLWADRQLLFLGSDGDLSLYLYASNQPFLLSDPASVFTSFEANDHTSGMVWGFSHPRNGNERVGDLIWEAKTALLSALFTGRNCLIYHPRENRWKDWEDLARAISYHQNHLIQAHLLTLKDAVIQTDVLTDELFLLCERMNYEYRKANNNAFLFPETWRRETDLAAAYPDIETFFSWLLGFFPINDEGRTAEQILLMLEQNLRDVPTLAVIGKELCMSQSTLSQILKRRTGKTYSELVQEKKMEKARELLTFTEKTMTEIADETGYTDQFYFSKTFKKFHGISPNIYRKQHKK